jgi:arsenate reductase
MNPTVLFLCKHNSSRSQMAEAFLPKYAGDRYGVISARPIPTEIHPHMHRVMNEVGIDLTEHRAIRLEHNES